jgi:hypothetical protein
MPWNKDVGPEVVVLSLFPDIIDRMRWILVQDNTGTSSDQRATTTCALVFAAVLFIKSKSIVGDGAFWIWQW